MTTYPIQATSISFNDIRQDLINFVQSKPDANRWKDFYAGSEGTILIELIAGYGFYNALKVIFSSEETYLRYANTLTSARAVAQNLAYSAYRGKNRRYRVKFTSNSTISIPAFTIIGYLGDYDFICLEDIVLNEGREATVYGVVGTFNSISMAAPSSNLHVFRFSDDLISEDYRLYLNDEEVPTTSINMEAVEDKYLVQSNAVGGVDVTYLNLNEDAQYPYRTGDILKLDYIQYQNIPFSGEIHIDYAEETEVVATENPEVPETIESIQSKAPIMYETQLVIRGREDYTKNLLLMNATFADTTGRDISPAYVELSYVQKDRSLITQEQEDQIFKKLSYKRMFGIPMPHFAKPRNMKVDMSITLKLTSSSITFAEYADLISEKLAPLEQKFSDDLEEVIIDLAEIERILETLPNVRRAQVSLIESIFKTDSFYEVGDTFPSENPNEIYRVTDIAYNTGSAEPDWSYVVDSLTVDGEVVWKAVPKSGFPIPWAAGETIVLTDLRVPTNPTEDGIMFRAVRGKSVSSPSGKPDWNVDLGSITYDEELIWLTVDYLATAPAWDTNTWFDLGDIVTVGSNSFQVIGERRKSGSALPNTEGSPDKVIYENMILTKEIISEERIHLPWGIYATINPNITASVQ